MSWVAPNLGQVCIPEANVSSCSQSTVLFLQLVASLFGKTKDVNRQNFNPINVESRFEPHHPFFHGHREIPTESFPEEEFDFIVVGAGSAGCVVANRLTEIPSWKVLLLEAGGEEPEVAEVPSFAPLLQRSNIDWGYVTQPSLQSCLARLQRQCYWGRGKVMGGCSAINYMIYIRGTPADYDGWAGMGNPGWKYKDVLPYFIKSEDNKNPQLVNLRYHGKGGYQNVEVYSFQDQNVYHVLGGFRELGLKEIDHNSEQQIGVSLGQATVRDGHRFSTNAAFIRPIRAARKNLVVRTGTQATKVLIDPHTKTAYGVEYYSNGRFYKVLAKKEVIVSSGAINSPQLLMLSGVGPADHLHINGIPVIKELPVGMGLQDHTTLDGVVVALSNQTSTLVSNERRDDDIHYYKKTHKGPISAPGVLQVIAMVQTKHEPSNNLPDIQYSLDSDSVRNFYANPILAAQTNVNPLSYYDGLMIRPILLTPKSRGYISLNSSDPVFGAPLIHPNTFVENIDLLRMVEGIKQALNLLRTESFKKINARLVTTPLPACIHHNFGTDEYWACVAKSYTTTIFHPVGTCKMGSVNDPTAVVDSTLKVHGIHNLRVIDASIMPKITRGNTNAPTIMIGEKGSDYIKQTWLKHEHFPDHHHFHDDFYGPGF